VKSVVTARHHLPRATIVSSQERGAAVAVVALWALVAVTEATTVVHMEGHMGHLALTGGAID